ncbi:MAG: hypothetical protein U0992_16940 [Planctomycetaceae bacterium]
MSSDERRAAADQERTTNSSHPSRWRRWLLLLMCGTLCVATCIVVAAYRAQIRRAKVADEVLKAGGYAEQPKSLLDTFRFVRSQGHFPTRQSYVMLKRATFDNDWIRRHDYLRDFEIRLLECTSITGDDLAKLIDAHPLEAFDTDDIELTPEVLRAIRDNTTLTQITLGDSRYGDEQFAEFPLERMKHVHLARTGVTPKGVLQVRRCPHLKSLSLDGSQLTDEVAAVLQSFGTITDLHLVGHEIDDKSLQSLHDVTTLRNVYLWDTTTTPEGRATLATFLPNCRIRTGTEADGLDDPD